jgi:hypothetical protein
LPVDTVRRLAAFSSLMVSPWETIPVGAGVIEGVTVADGPTSDVGVRSEEPELHAVIPRMTSERAIAGIVNGRMLGGYARIATARGNMTRMA